MDSYVLLPPQQRHISVEVLPGSLFMTPLEVFEYSHESAPSKVLALSPRRYTNTKNSFILSAHGLQDASLQVFTPLPPDEGATVRRFSLREGAC